MATLSQRQHGAVRLLGIARAEGAGALHCDLSSAYHVDEDGTVSWEHGAAADFGGAPVAAVLGADPSLLPSGVLDRRGDGSEALRSVDGYRLELDGRGGATVWDASGQRRIRMVGLFYVHERD